MNAGEELQAAAIAALGAVDGLGVFDGLPVQAAAPHAVVEVGPETDWGHKSGAGREVRLAVTIRDEGERPARLQRLMAEAVSALAGVGPNLESWRIVTMQFARSRVVQDRRGSWAGVIEHRVRMLAVT